MRYILTADWHLREDQPPCRTDDFQSAQWEKVRYVLDLAKEHKATVLVAGDVFHKARPSHALVHRLISELRDADVVLNCIAGNHDLPSHNLEMMPSSAYGVVTASGWINNLPRITMFGRHDVITAWQWGQKVGGVEADRKRKFNIAVVHALVFPDQIPSHWEAAEKTWTAPTLMEHLSDFQFILTGHHHKEFLVQDKDQMLLNPGCLTRQTADQTDHKPCVYLLDSAEGNCDRVELPHAKGVVSREHLDVVTKRDERIAKFVDGLKGNDSPELDFIANLLESLEANKLDEMTKQIILQSIEEADDGPGARADRPEKADRKGENKDRSPGNGKAAEGKRAGRIRIENPYASRANA